jgi:hypothetical protein
MQGAPIDNLIRGLTMASLWGVVKVMFLVGLGIYLVFALVMIRQVQLMANTLNGTLNLPLKLVAWVHLGIAIGVFLMGLVVL